MSYIIAEIGFNHDGNLPLAIEMIKSAALSGANAVKFQTFRASDIALPSAPHYDLIKSAEFDMDQYKQLFNVAKEFDVDFLSTPFSLWAVDLLEVVGVSAYKVASMDCTNKHLLKRIARTGKPVYISTGMATLAEIGETLGFMEQEKSGSVSILHCMSIYPPEAKDLNLNIISFLKQIFNVPVGYSDHYPGVKACFAAAMLGADIIETHFTLDTAKEGADHHHSADQDMIKGLIEEIALFKEMNGNNQAIYHRQDRSFTEEFRRGLYVSRDMSKGEVVNEEDLLQCRPVSELSPNDLEWLKGKVVNQGISAFQPLERRVIDEPAK